MIDGDNEIIVEYQIFTSSFFLNGALRGLQLCDVLMVALEKNLLSGK